MSAYDELSRPPETWSLTSMKFPSTPAPMHLRTPLPMRLLLPRKDVLMLLLARPQSELVTPQLSATIIPASSVVLPSPAAASGSNAFPLSSPFAPDTIADLASRDVAFATLAPKPGRTVTPKVKVASERSLAKEVADAGLIVRLAKEVADAGLIPPSSEVDYVAKHTPPGMPRHSLRIKVGGVYRLMRNLSVDRGLVKNVRAVVTDIGYRLVTVHVLKTQMHHDISTVHADDIVLPRITFDTPLHSGHTLRRRQIPLSPAYGAKG